MQIAIDDYAHDVVPIVDQAKRRHRSRLEPQCFINRSGEREAELTVPDLIGDGAQIRLLRVLEHHQVVAIALLVAQKEILAMGRVDPAQYSLRFVDRRHGRMLVTLPGATPSAVSFA